MIESPRHTLYGVLGLAQDATTIDIERAVLLHKRVLQQHAHADRQREHLKLVEEARVVLLDPRKREAYDHQLQRASAVAPGQLSRISVWLGWSLAVVFVVELVWFTYRANSAAPASAATAAPALDKKSETPNGDRKIVGTMAGGDDARPAVVQVDRLAQGR